MDFAYLEYLSIVDRLPISMIDWLKLCILNGVRYGR